MLAGRGFATAALLVLVALTCIAIAKRLEGERLRFALTGALIALGLAVSIAVVALR